MSLKKTKTTAVLAASLFALPVLAHATDLDIINQTRYKLSFKVNNVCSNEFGHMHSYSTKKVKEVDFLKACVTNTTPCQVDVYDNKTCDGKLLATVKYDMEKHHVDLTGYQGNNLTISVSGFYLLSLAEPVETSL